jgi:hypothetical protein
MMRTTLYEAARPGHTLPNVMIFNGLTLIKTYRFSICCSCEVKELRTK